MVLPPKQFWGTRILNEVWHHFQVVFRLNALSGAEFQPPGRLEQHPFFRGEERIFRRMEAG
jgi:hypothetical protein